jgi:hypothetical protein
MTKRSPCACALNGQTGGAEDLRAAQGAAGRSVELAQHGRAGGIGGDNRGDSLVEFVQG